MANLFNARNKLAVECDRLGRFVPSIQISEIINHQNVGDLAFICDAIARVALSHRRVVGDEDAMNNHWGNHH